jgi:hypothetical protein
VKYLSYALLSAKQEQFSAPALRSFESSIDIMILLIFYIFKSCNVLGRRDAFYACKDLGKIDRVGKA